MSRFIDLRINLDLHEICEIKRLFSLSKWFKNQCRWLETQTNGDKQTEQQQTEHQQMEHQFETWREKTAKFKKCCCRRLDVFHMCDTHRTHKCVSPVWMFTGDRSHTECFSLASPPGQLQAPNPKSNRDISGANKVSGAEVSPHFIIQGSSDTPFLSVISHSRINDWCKHWAVNEPVCNCVAGDDSSVSVLCHQPKTHPPGLTVPLGQVGLVCLAPSPVC